MRKNENYRKGVGGIVQEEDQTTSSLGCIICSNVYWCMFLVKANQAKEFEKNDYGVFLNADASSLERFKTYETIVIDAQYFTKGILNCSIKMEQSYIHI